MSHEVLKAVIFKIFKLYEIEWGFSLCCGLFGLKGHIVAVISALLCRNMRPQVNRDPGARVRPFKVNLFILYFQGFKVKMSFGKAMKGQKDPSNPAHSQHTHVFTKNH